jgi:hypothetical protein
MSLHEDHEFGKTSPLKSIEIHGNGVTIVAKPELFEDPGVARMFEGAKPIEGGLMQASVPLHKATDALHELWEAALESDGRLRTAFIKKVAVAAQKEIGSAEVPIAARI